MSPRLARALRRLLPAVALAVFACSGRPLRGADVAPTVSVWYRGVPAGTPRLDDLVAIHATGFDAITWPAAQTAQLASLRVMAKKAGLTVMTRAGAAISQPAATPIRGVQPSYLDLSLLATVARGGQLPAIIWNNIAHGAREIALDPQPPAGFVRWSDDASLREWARAAAVVAKDVSRCGSLINALKPLSKTAPPVRMETPLPASVDFALLDAGRSWVIIATNRSGVRQSVQVHLPKDVAAAEWENMLTSSVVAMIAKPDGPRWTCALEPWQAKVLVIDKRPH